MMSLFKSLDSHTSVMAVFQSSKSQQINRSAPRCHPRREPCDAGPWTQRCGQKGSACSKEVCVEFFGSYWLHVFPIVKLAPVWLVSGISSSVWYHHSVPKRVCWKTNIKNKQTNNKPPPIPNSKSQCSVHEEVLLFLSDLCLTMA